MKRKNTNFETFKKFSFLQKGLLTFIVGLILTGCTPTNDISPNKVTEFRNDLTKGNGLWHIIIDDSPNPANDQFVQFTADKDPALYSSGTYTSWIKNSVNSNSTKPYTEIGTSGNFECFSANTVVLTYNTPNGPVSETWTLRNDYGDNQKTFTDSKNTRFHIQK